MKRFGTILFTLMLAFAGDAAAQDCTSANAQDVTVRDINHVTDDEITELMSAGVSLTHDEIVEILTNDLWGSCVRFRAVILSDPLNSGLASVSDDRPGRIHVYVRDTTANSQGVEGMGIQLVDGSYETTGLIDAAIGDVVDVVASVNVFTGTGGVNLQVSPESLTLIGSIGDFGIGEEILEPVLVTTADLNMPVEGDGNVQVNWENFRDLNGQYVRIENATLVARDISSERPDWLITSDGGETVINIYDMSLRYRNDRENYPDTFNKRSDDFVPPPPGTTLDLQGYVTYQGDDPFGRGNPDQQLLNIAPFADSDLLIREAPPEAAVPSKPATVPGEGEAVTVTSEITADPSRTISSATLTYWTSADPTEQEVAMTHTEGVTYEAEIPGQDDGVFVFYNVTAEDSEGASFTTGNQQFRVLEGGITEIRHIQETFDEAEGDGPFVGMTADMDLTATVQTDPATSRIIALQDDPDQAPWTGIVIRVSDALAADLEQGDVINITNAEIQESNGLTRLSNPTYTKTGSEDPIPHKVITTNALSDRAVAEAHEGMLVRFENVIVTSTNPDAPSGPFGEWGLSSDGSEEAQVRADDNSEAISQNFAGSLNIWERYDFQQGVWGFSFSNFKLWPETVEGDIGVVTNVAVGDDELPGKFALKQNYPNPFNPVTTIQYDVPTSARVTLEVLDMLGRRVATLVSQDQPAGSYTITFDAQDLSSGLYLYRLTAGSETTTRKMVVLK